MDFFNIIHLIVYFTHCIIFIYAYGSKPGVNNNNNDENVYELHPIRVRRSLSAGSDTSCKDILDKEAENKIKKNPFPLKDDKNADLQLVFLGENSETQVLLTTMPNSFLTMFSHFQSHLYQSIDGGQTFQKLQEKIGSVGIRSNNGLMKSPLDHNWIILVAETKRFSLLALIGKKKQHSSLIISKNAGKNFTTFTLPFQLRNGEPLLFHPKKKHWIIALENVRTIMIMGSGVQRYGFAWISKDFGRTWKVMMDGHVAISVKWGLAEGKEGDEIYLSTSIKRKRSGNPFFSMFSSSSDTTLWRSSDGGKLFEEIVEHCLNFGVRGDFIFASVVFNSTNKSPAFKTKRIMHVSKDGGTTFRPIHLPEITSSQFYAVFESYKGMIFLHVDEHSDNGKGTLYISDAQGLMYTKSLANHFYTNSGYTDFTKVESMPGVYITQQLQTDNTIRSVITFNRGVSWQPLYINKKTYCKNEQDTCTLHYHKDYSKVKMRNIETQGPLSAANAPGIIFIHGQPGDALTGVAQVWLSINGGYNWTRIADSPHHYAIGDNGNLLVIVPKFNNTGNMLKYSIDQGICWHDYKFYDDKEMVIRGLVTEPHAKHRTFSLWGFVKDASVNAKEWKVITINFHGMFSRKCDTGDFVEWSSHILNEKKGCFLGKKIFYRKTKPTANCYLGKDFNPEVRTTKCKCDKDDLECDYGYERQSSDKMCKENKSIKPIEFCKKGEKMKERFSKGYKRLPGDVCKATKAVDDVVKFIDEGIKCEPSVIDAYGILKEEKEVIEEEKKEKEREDVSNDGSNDETTVTVSHHVKKHSKAHKFFILVAVLVVIGTVIGGAYYGTKFCRNRIQKPTYVMSELTEEDDSRGTFDPRPKGLREYRDESEFEDDVMLPV